MREVASGGIGSRGGRRLTSVGTRDMFRLVRDSPIVLWRRTVRRSAASAIAILLLGISFHAPARAGSWNVHAGAGAVFPAGSAALQEGLGTGLGATVGVGHDLVPWLQIILRTAYNDFPRDDEGTLLVAGIDKRPMRILEMTGGTMTAWDAVVELQVSLSPDATIVHPYVTGAAGLTSYRYERVDIAYAYAGHTWPATIAGEEATDACLAAGGGVRFAACRWLDLGIDTRLHVALRGAGALWSVPLWLTLIVSP